MGAILFKVFGFGVTGRLLAKIALGAGIAALLLFAYTRVRNHFDHIAEIEAANKKLKTDLTVAEGQRDQVVDLNKENDKTLKLDQEVRTNNQAIATAERAAANARTQTYKEIRNAIQSTPSTHGNDAPMSDRPAVSAVLNGLWADTSTGNSN